MTISTFGLAARRIEGEARYAKTGHDELAGWWMDGYSEESIPESWLPILSYVGVGVVSIRAMLLGMTEDGSTTEEEEGRVTQRAAITSG
jgi:hypothetical protein